MLNEDIIGLSIEETFQYTWRDLVLYNLSVGATQENLELVYEKGLKAVPTYGTIPCVATFGVEPHRDYPVMPTSLVKDLPGGKFLHMDHSLRLFRPLPTQAKIYIKKEIVDLYDRGDRGAKIVVEITGTDENDTPLFVNKMGYLKQGCGNFGGKKETSRLFKLPASSPTSYAEGAFPENVALLYRLTGDTFPLHADPEIAKQSGFDRPIIHGLCSLGYACRTLVDLLFPGRPERMTQIETQFRTVAFPGDTFVILVWKIGDGKAVFRMLNSPSGMPILDFGRIYWN